MLYEVITLAGIIVIYAILSPSGDDAIRLRGVVLGSLVIFGGGLIDDYRDVSPWVQS